MADSSGFLSNHFLIAMPMLTDPYFSHGVTYICEHNENGAIGIVINHPLELNLADVFKQMDITTEDQTIGQAPVLCGGPVHPERGFVIHSPEGSWRSSLAMSEELAVTTSRDILQAIATSKGPENVLISLGYASWTAGQLEQEIIDNFWLTSPANLEVLFKIPFADRWNHAVKLLGIDISKLSMQTGHA